jgi:hypothetical protein
MPRRRSFRPTILVLDGGIYRITTWNETGLTAERLRGDEEALATRMLRSIHLEIDALIRASRAGK